MTPSYFEEVVLNRIRFARFPLPVREHVFCPGRRFRFDFAWIEQKIAVECEGGVWSRGRHTRGQGFTADTEKYNLAVLHGWRVLRYTPQTVDKIVEDLKILLAKTQRSE